MSKPIAVRAAEQRRSAAPPPTRYRDSHGVLRLLGRRHSLQLEGAIYCPQMHRIRNARDVLEEGIFRCKFRPTAGTAECGILLYVIAGFRSRSDDDLLWAVEVTEQEVRQLRRMSIAAKLDYLEVTWLGIG